jgi:hypothetical protein
MYEDVETQFNEEFDKADDLLCTKEELLADDKTMNKDGRPRRPCNSFVRFRREFIKRATQSPLFEPIGGSRSILPLAAEAWKELSKSKRYIFELAFHVANKRFLEANPGYKYRPRPPSGGRRKRGKRSLQDRCMIFTTK